MPVRDLQFKALSSAGFHSVAYREWGDPKNPEVLICVHGLTRCSHDFDALAQRLSQDFRVVAPDVVGRGRSGWLRDPMLYQVPQYAADMATLIARLNADEVNWLGTSMGGLIGMALASQPGSPIRRLLLNDVGPVLVGAALERIAQYVGLPIRFSSYEEGAAFVKANSLSFGPHSAEQWDHIARHVMRQKDDGSWVLHYDPAIATPFKSVLTYTDGKPNDLEFWPIYDAISCPTLVVRGAESDLLARETWLQMAQRGPKAQLKELAGVGHAPMFMQPDQIELAREFFMS